MLWWAGLLSALGALGLVVANIFYGLSPVAAASPAVPFDAGAAMKACSDGAATLRIAGAVGIFGDLVWAPAALLLAQESGRSGRTLAAAGWSTLFFAVLLFVFVDGMTGFVFPQIAASSKVSAFEGLRRLWDMIFLLSAAAFGLGSVEIAIGELVRPARMLNRFALAVLLAIGAIGILAAALCFAGVPTMTLPAGEIAGGSIGLGSLVYIPLGLLSNRSSRRSAASKSSREFILKNGSGASGSSSN